MKIIYHHRTRAEDAQGIHIREIIRAMKSLGHEVKLVSLVEGDSTEVIGRVPSESKGKGNRKRNAFIYEIMTLAYNAYGLFKLGKAVQCFSPDMIYERYSLNSFCGILVSKVFKVPIVLEVNAPLSFEHGKYEKLLFDSLAVSLERWICSNASKTIVVSNVLKDMLIKMGVPEKRIVVMHNGVDPEEFSPTISGDPVRRRWGLDGKIILGFVGWFRKWHGIEMLIDIFREEGWGEKNVHLMLVGDGPARDDIEKQVGNLGLKSSVTITGPVHRSEIPSYIAAFDIALQPSVTEYASPMKIFEYMSMGKCIIAPAQPNIHEILHDGSTGLLFRPRDREQIKNTIRNALTVEGIRESIGSKARQAIFDNGYLWTRNAERAIKLAFSKPNHTGMGGYPHP